MCFAMNTEYFSGSKPKYCELPSTVLLLFLQLEPQKKKQSFNQISFVRVHVFLRFIRPKQHELLHGRAPSGDVEGLLH